MSWLWKELIPFLLFKLHRPTTGSDVASEPGIKDTWTECMSRRTKWRSIIQKPTGLLEFWKLPKKELVELWLNSCLALPQSWSLGAACPRLVWSRLDLHSNPRRVANKQTSKGTPRRGAQRVRCVHRSDVKRFLLLNKHHSKGEPPDQDHQLFLSHVHSQAAAARGREPGKEVRMRYQKRNWHLWVLKQNSREVEKLKKRKESNLN